MVAFLVVCVGIFKKFPKTRLVTLCVLSLGGLIEAINGVYPDGVGIGFLTLTCAGLLAVFYFVKVFAFRVLASLPFFALGGFLVLEVAEFMEHATISFVYYTNLTAWIVMFSWALTALGGGALILIVAFRSRFA
jgi:hypothetical protein